MPLVYWFVAEVDPRNAGYRVRTLPIVNELRAQGVEVNLLPTAELPTKIPELLKHAHAVIVSKPGDTSTYLCMRHLAESHVTLVADLFDNYFSWSPSLYKKQLHWQWLRSLECVSVVITSTSYLTRVVCSLTSKPVIEVSDMVPPARQAAAALEYKWPVRDGIELLWFGIAGNPYFTAGLADLKAWSGVLRDLVRRIPGGREVRLTVCTNRVPAVESVLSEMRVNEIEARFVEWSEETCAELLAKTHVVLLPTNTTGFSLSKTHNRCSDALTSGCLVLCSPNGPYAALQGAVFDDGALLASTLARVSAVGARDLINQSLATLQQHGDLSVEVTALRKAMAAASRPQVKASGLARASSKVLVAGRIKADPIKFSRTIGYLVAGFADSPLKLTYDISLDKLGAADATPSVQFSERAWTQLLDIVARNVEMDSLDLGGHIECRAAGWVFHLDKGTRKALVVAGVHSATIRRLHLVQAIGRRNGQSDITLFEHHVDLLGRVLWQLGFREIDYAADDAGGWEEFAHGASPGLMAQADRLRQLWVEHAGNELAWGGMREVAS